VISGDFARMAMNDEETVALIASDNLKTMVLLIQTNTLFNPQLVSKSKVKVGKTVMEKVTQKIQLPAEGAWTTTPTKWSNNYYFENLFGFEWN
jgi:catalase-peroxidase